MKRSKCQISFLVPAALFQPLDVIGAPMMSVTLVLMAVFQTYLSSSYRGSKTASAAEIVVAALKENQRARVAGQRSYGKGSVQTIFDLSDGGGVKLTVAKYMTPSGRFIESQGVEPDDLIVTPDSDVLVRVGLGPTHRTKVKTRDAQYPLAWQSPESMFPQVP